MNENCHMLFSCLGSGRVLYCTGTSERLRLAAETEELRRRAGGMSQAAQQRATARGDSMSNADFLAARSRPVHTAICPGCFVIVNSCTPSSSWLMPYVQSSRCMSFT